MEDAMTFGERVVGAMKLDPHTYEDVERDTTAMGQAVGVIVLAAVASGIGRMFAGGLSGLVLATLFGLIGWTIWAFIVWVIGTKVMPDPQTKADVPETFRVLGFSAAPGLLSILTIIPILGLLIGLVIWCWQIATMVVAVRQVLDYNDWAKPIIVVVIGFVVNLIVTLVLLVPYIGARMLMG
jgi:hypothetical protein